MAITLSADDVGNIELASPLEFDLVIPGALVDGLIVVIGCARGEAITGATVNGNAVDADLSFGTDVRVFIGSLAVGSLSAGTYPVVISAPGDSVLWIAGAALAVNGADQSAAALRRAGTQTASNTSADPSLEIVTDTPGALIVDGLGSSHDAAPTMGAQTNRVQMHSGVYFFDSAAASRIITKALAGSQVMNWTQSSSTWAQAAVAYKPAAGGGKATKNTRSHPLGLGLGMGRRIGGRAA